MVSSLHDPKKGVMDFERHSNEGLASFIFEEARSLRTHNDSRDGEM